MRVVPEQQEKRIAFFEQRVERWAADPGAVGIPPDVVAELAELTAAARHAYKAAQVARTQAQMATQTLKAADRAMARLGASAIQCVGVKATHDGDGVYSKASLPPPSRRRTRLGPPGHPQRLRMRLMPNGSLVLTWTARQPRGAQGTQYQVDRRIVVGPPDAGAGGMPPVTDGGYVHLGTVGDKRFVDDTLPAGTVRVLYRVRGVRSTIAGEWAELTVNLGTNKRRPARPLNVPKQPRRRRIAQWVRD